MKIQIKKISAYPTKEHEHGHAYVLNLTKTSAAATAIVPNMKDVDLLLRGMVKALAMNWELSFRYLPNKDPCVVIVKYTIDRGYTRERAFVFN